MPTKPLLSKRGASPARRPETPKRRPETPKSGSKKKVKKVVKKKKAKAGDALQSPQSVLNAPSAFEADEADVQVIFVEDLYALQRCTNCTFWYFALCVNCPRCNELTVPVRFVEDLYEESPNEEKSTGGEAERVGGEAERASGDETDTTTALAARLFAGLDTQKRGLLPAEALIHSVRAHFHTQPTEQPEHWVRTLIVKNDSDRDGELTETELAHALSCLVRL